MNKLLKIGLIATLCLGACAPRQHYIYVNSNPKAHNFDKDRYDCLKESATAAPTTRAVAYDPLVGATNYDMNDAAKEQMMLACMKAREWSLVPDRPVVTVQQ